MFQLGGSDQPRWRSSAEDPEAIKGLAPGQLLCFNSSGAFWAAHSSGCLGEAACGPLSSPRTFPDPCPWYAESEMSAWAHGMGWRGAGLKWGL